MGNPLKKTMVFLGLAEEDLDDRNTPAADARVETDHSNTPAAVKPAQRAQVTPLRKVAPVRQAGMSAMNEILTVHPTGYSDAPSIAESFREGVPAILNLSKMSEPEAKQLIDFASGLVMGLRGRIERVTNKVFLLLPEHIALSGDDDAAESDADSFFVSATA